EICRTRGSGCSRSRVAPLIHFSRARVEQVVNVEVHVGPAFLEDPKLENLAQPKIHGIQTVAVERTELNDVQELDGVSTAERPSERRRVDDAGDVESESLSAKALGLHRGEFVAGIGQAAERTAQE